MNGVGAILYTGNPREVNTRMNGLGTIAHRDPKDMESEETEDTPADPDTLQPEYERPKQKPATLIADKGFDCQPLRNLLAWLGIEPQGLTRDLAQALALERTDGVLIRGLQVDGPAQKAGVHARDVIVEISGRPTPDVPQLLARIAELKPGSSARLKVWREGKLRELDVTVARRPRVQP